MPADLTALVTAAGSMPGVAVIRALKAGADPTIRVVAADAAELAVGHAFADARVVAPRADEPGFIDRMLRICEDEDVGILFPVIDEELQAFADAAGRFEAAGVRVVGNSAAAVGRARDNYRTYLHCREHGIRAPKTWLAGDQPDDVGYPLIVKPRMGRGGVGVSLAADRRDLDHALRHTDHAIAQEHLSGQEYTIDILGDLQGRVLMAVPKRRIETKAGMQVKGRVELEPPLIEFGMNVARAFELAPRGNVQCIVGPGGAISLVEVNPKFAASTPLTVAAGVNIPRLLSGMHLGLAVEVPEARDGVLMLRCWHEVFYG